MELGHCGHCGLFVNMFLAVVVLNLLVLGFSFGEVLGHCGGHSSSSSGTIQSPNYPKAYPAGEECIWTVAIDGSIENIRLSFSSFDLQPKSADGNCVDYVAIFRLQLNKDPGAVLEGKFCGDSTPKSIKIEESSMTVQFISDSVANPHTGFSLHFEANFKDTTSVSQATAGIVAAIFCAVVFIGVGMLRCMMMGACNTCGGPNPADQNRNRHVVATSDSYQYQADFPPSYSTVMDHPERYPTPETSPAVTQNRNRVATDGSHTPSQTQLHERPGFTIQSSDSNSSDEDDSDTPPPPYPGLVTSDDEVNVDIATDNSNGTTDNQPNTGSHNVGVVIDDEQSYEPPVSSCEVPSSEVEDEQNPSTAVAAHQALSDASTVAGSSPQERDNSLSRGDIELSQIDVPDDEAEMVFMI